MRRILYLNFEPWVHIGGSFSEAARYFLADHFSGGGISVLWASGISVLTLVVLGVTRFNGARLLLPAFVLLLVAVLTSLAASGIALWRTYWVLERQWVAGIAIACIASVWFFGELYSLARRNQTPIILIPVGLFVILSLVTMAVTMRAEAEKLLVGYPAARAAIIDDGRPPPELGIGQYGGMDGVEAANLNIARGGPVWIEFIDWYNHKHLHSGINFVPPAIRHAGLDRAVLAKRDNVYQAARASRPQRWSGNHRNWSIAGQVTLNPSKKMARSVA